MYYSHVSLCSSTKSLKFTTADQFSCSARPLVWTWYVIILKCLMPEIHWLAQRTETQTAVRSLLANRYEFRTSWPSYRQSRLLHSWRLLCWVVCPWSDWCFGLLRQLLELFWIWSWMTVPKRPPPQIQCEAGGMILSLVWWRFLDLCAVHYWHLATVLYASVAKCDQ